MRGFVVEKCAQKCAIKKVCWVWESSPPVKTRSQHSHCIMTMFLNRSRITPSRNLLKLYSPRFFHAQNMILAPKNETAVTERAPTIKARTVKVQAPSMMSMTNSSSNHTETKQSSTSSTSYHDFSDNGGCPPTTTGNKKTRKYAHAMPRCAHVQDLLKEIS